MAVTYASLTPSGICDEFAGIARDAPARFGRYSSTQLNWQLQPDRWSIAQCFDHLVKSDHEMLQAIGRALDREAPRTMWQRLPLWPRLFGRLLVTSQSPGGRQKYQAPASARPASSDIGPDVIEQFAASQQSMIARLRALDADDLRRVMASPFVAQITYSVLDGYRLIAAHQRRHFQQAERVAEHPEFPGV